MRRTTKSGVLILGLLAACGSKPASPPLAPQAVARLRDLVFADQDLADVVKLQPPVDDPSSPWPRLAAAARLRGEEPEAATAELEQVLALPGLETRVQLWTWTALRDLGAAPDAGSADVVQGVVIETPVDGGVDTLAVFRDGTMRYFDHGGKAAFRDAHAAPASPELADLVQAPITLAERLAPEDRGPVTRPRAPANPGATRVSLLTFRGVRSRELPAGALRDGDPLAPLVKAGSAIVQKVRGSVR